MRVVVTGGAGFIGSSLVDSLLSSGHSVVAIDNFSTGQHSFLTGAATQDEFRLVETDLLGPAALLDEALTDADAVFHLAANADVRFGWDHPTWDVEQNLLATQNLLESCRRTGVRRVVFSSTGSVYGEAQVIPTPENAPFPVQTSLYGATKVAAEGLLSAYSEGAGFSVTVFRFVSVLGPRYTHGHVVDFLAQLRRDPSKLRVLGDGLQRKSYMDVSDCVAALTAALDRTPTFELYNLGADEYCTVLDSIGWITARLGVSPELHFTGGDRGWVGDNPFIWLDTTAVRATGWAPVWSIREAVERTVDFLRNNPSIVETMGIDQ